MPIHLTKADGIATVSLYRPDKLNALDPAHLVELRARLAEADADPEVRVTVLTGAGGRAFCVGADQTAPRAEEVGIAEAIGLDLAASAERGLYIRLFNLDTLALKKPLERNPS